MMEKLEKLNLLIGQTISNVGDWCERNAEKIEFYGTHIVLPAAVGMVAGRMIKPNIITNVYYMDHNVNDSANVNGPSVDFEISSF